MEKNGLVDCHECENRWDCERKYLGACTDGKKEDQYEAGYNDAAQEIIAFVAEKDKKAGKYSIYSKLLQELKERFTNE